MDKLETETWEEYAFKNKLFKIIYADKEQHVIKDVIIPDSTVLNDRHCDWGYYMNCVNGSYGKVGFLDFIMHEIYTLRDKYKTGFYCCSIQLVQQMTKEREDDIERQKWLFKEEAFWEQLCFRKTMALVKVPYMNEEQKEALRREKEDRDKQRYHELKSIISETHKEPLDELLALFSHIQPVLRKEIRQAESQERVKVYQNYLKNKDIKSKISELEQKLNQLKNELV